MDVWYHSPMGYPCKLPALFVEQFQKVARAHPLWTNEEVAQRAMLLIFAVDDLGTLAAAVREADPTIPRQSSFLTEAVR